MQSHTLYNIDGFIFFPTLGSASCLNSNSFSSKIEVQYELHFVVKAYIPKQLTKLLLKNPTTDKRIPHCANVLLQKYLSFPPRDVKGKNLIEVQLGSRVQSATAERQKHTRWS